MTSENICILLGTGTSTGVPIPGCRCSVCLSGNSKNFRNRASALIRLSNGKEILIDAGPDFRHQCLAHSVDRIDAVLYTHSHADHIYGTDDLRVFNFSKGGPIPCYGSESTIAGIQTAFPYLVNPAKEYMGGFLAQLDFITISNDRAISLLGTQIEPFPLPHGHVTVTGFRIGSLGYATDCKGLTPRAQEILTGVDTLVIDGLRRDPHNTHNSITEAIDIGRTLGANKTVLTHLAHDIDYTSVTQELPPGVYLGFDGMTLPFNP